MLDNIFDVTVNSYTTTEATLIILIHGMNNMNNLGNLNNLNSINSLGNDLNSLNGMGIGMSNISNRDIGNLGNDMRNEMANVDGMNGIRQEKFKSNVFGNHYNLNPTDYLHFGFFNTNTVTYGRYTSSNNDNINSRDNTNIHNLNNLGNPSNLNNLNDGNNGASNLSGGICNDFLNLNSFGNLYNT